MKVLINAITITEGGGKVVLSRLLEHMQEIDKTISWYVAAEPTVLSHLPESHRIIGIPYSWARKSPWHTLYWYELELPKLVSRVKADLCFSQTNFLSRRRLSCPSLLMVHNAGFFSDLYTQLQLKYYRNLKEAILWKQKIKWSHDSIRRATAVTVQTQALADKITNQLQISQKKIFTIPHGLGLLNTVAQSSRDFPTDAYWRVGYITKFGPQKDFVTAIKAISQLKNAGIPIKLVLTLNPNIREYPLVLQQIVQYGIQDIVENQGEVTDPNDIKKIYESLHFFIFPSLVESFGFTLVEAMACGLPVIAADTKSNREITGVAGELVPAENAEALAKKIKHLINNIDSYTVASKNSLTRSNNFSWHKTGQEMLHLMYQILMK